MGVGWLRWGWLLLRLPWWLLLLAAVPWLVIRLVVVVVRYRRALPRLAAVVAVLWCWQELGTGRFALAVAVLAAGVGVWWWRWPRSCTQLVLRPVWSWWRRWWVYRRRWARALTMCGLGARVGGRLWVPGLGSVRCTPATDEVTVAMLPGQTPQLFHHAAARLAYAFGLRTARVYSSRPPLAGYRSGLLAPVGRLADRWRYRDRPRLLTVVFLRRDLLTAVVAPFPVPAVPDLAALPVGVREDGRVYALRVHATHVLVTGATRSGKGSVIWSVVRAVAGAIASGLVRLWGIDPKGGMELALGRGLFARLEAADYPAMADMLEQLVTVMRQRQATLSGRVRVHTPTVAQPLYLLVVDELSALTAYLPDTDVRNRILAALGLILSQGAGLGVLVLAATQDPRKQTVALRDLFPTRIALRLTEPGHVNLILGDGARDRGALADQIPADPAHRGIGYVQLDGQPEPMRLRFTHLTDTDIQTMARDYPAVPDTPPPPPPAAPARALPAPPGAGGATTPKQRGGRPGPSGEGPLLPPGLRDALGSDDRNDPGAGQ